MECLKLTYKPLFELRTHERMPSREAKVVQMFISVDPLAEKAPNWTPYRYGFNNPIMFVDPTGLWEFQYNSESKTLGLHKSNDKDNLESFMKESGLSKNQIAKKMFGGGKSGKEAMNNFFNSGKNSINVSEMSGELGEMLQGMETASTLGYFFARSDNSDTGMIFGNIRLEATNNSTIHIGNKNTRLIDLYDFDTKNGSFYKRSANALGEHISTIGGKYKINNYSIYGYGTKKARK